MKKKILSLIMCFVMLFGFCMSSLAVDSMTENMDAQTIEYFEDGSYLVTVYYENPVLTRGTIYNKSCGRILTFYDNNGNKMWDVEFNTTFKVNEGVSATCTAASFSAPRIYDSSWRYITNTTSKNGNKGSGTITMKKYFMGLPVRTETPTITVTCDKNGNLS